MQEKVNSRNLTTPWRVGRTPSRRALPPMRVVMYQREATPFTLRDQALWKKVFQLYPRRRMTPLPMFSTDEPKFEVARKEAREIQE